jgi:hypothetical protein
MKILNALALVLFMALPWQANAQQQVLPCVSNFSTVTGETSCQNVTATFGLPVVPLQGGSAVGSGNPLYVQGTLTTTPAVGVLDPNNSSTATLSGGAAFTGTATNVLSYAFINVLVYADQNSAATATAGVALEFSSDGTNWDDAQVNSFVAGSSAPNAGQVYGSSVRAKYFRVVYTNGASGQGTFRLSTLLMPSFPGADATDLSIPLVAHSHALVTSSAISAKAGSNFVNLKADSASNLLVGGSGSAGTASTSVLTVQGIASMTPLLATVSQGTAANLNMTEANSAAILSAAQGPVPPFPVPHASTSALGTSLVAKASAGDLFGFNCTAITGGAAGYCVAYNAASAPGTGSLTGASVLDFCYFDTTARGCSLSRIPLAAAYSTGITILLTSAASPYTYTTGTDTGAISADYE